MRRDRCYDGAGTSGAFLGGCALAGLTVRFFVETFAFCSARFAFACADLHDLHHFPARPHAFGAHADFCRSSSHREQCCVVVIFMAHLQSSRGYVRRARSQAEFLGAFWGPGRSRPLRKPA